MIGVRAPTHAPIDDCTRQTLSVRCGRLQSVPVGSHRITGTITGTVGPGAEDAGLGIALARSAGARCTQPGVRLRSPLKDRAASVVGASNAMLAVRCSAGAHPLSCGGSP